jgi:hypoxanthine phosphoribosyltransferase
MESVRLAGEVTPLLTKQQIDSRIAEMGAQITAEYAGRQVHLVCILKGACVFLSDLARAIDLHVSLDFMAVSSYGKGTKTTGEVRITKDLDSSIENVDVIIVEDIVDTGLTLNYLRNLLISRKPRSLRIATLLDKPSRRIQPVKVEYVGFEIPDEFVIGYGLDFAEKYRNLKDVCVLNPAAAK